MGSGQVSGVGPVTSAAIQPDGGSGTEKQSMSPEGRPPTTAPPGGSALASLGASLSSVSPGRDST